MTKIVDSNELAEILKVSQDTVDSWHRRGLIPGLRVGPGPELFDLAEVKTALAERTIEYGSSRPKTRSAMSREVEFGSEDTIDEVRLPLDFRDPINALPPQDLPALGVGEYMAKRPKDERPKFQYNNNDIRRIDPLIDHLAEQKDIYARLDQLMQVAIEKDSLHQQVFCPLGMCEELSDIAQIGSYAGRSGKWRERSFPEQLGRQIIKQETWKGVRSLRRISSMPILSEAGLCQRLGYDPLTGLFYYTPDYRSIPTVSRNPTRQQANDGLAFLIDLIGEFPFAELRHRSAWLASLLGVVARPMLGPCAPMTVIDGDRIGVGEDLLLQLISDICLPPGEFASTFTGLNKNNRKQRNTLLFLARENPLIGIVHIASDGTVASPVVNRILDTGSVSGHVLGFKKIAAAAFDTTFFATGNCLKINEKFEVLGRIFHVLLRSPCMSYKQSRFKYPEIRNHARLNRGRYLVAALTVMEYTRLNREILPTVTPSGSPSGYDIVRQVLVDLGEQDPSDSVSVSKSRPGAL